MSEYNEALQALSIEEKLLKIELSTLINLLPSIRNCKMCFTSKLLAKENKHIDIHELRLEFPELKNSCECFACSKTISNRCHKYVESKHKHTEIIKQLFEETSIDLQVVREKIRLLADRKEIYENEHSTP